MIGKDNLFPSRRGCSSCHYLENVWSKRDGETLYTLPVLTDSSPFYVSRKSMKGGIGTTGLAVVTHALTMIEERKIPSYQPGNNRVRKAQFGLATLHVHV